MVLKKKLILLLCYTSIVYPFDYRDWDNSVLLPKRIRQLMINYNDRSVARINEITNIRSKYEETPHFQLGYVMSEILERYRKMVEHVKKPIEYESYVLFDTIKQTELIQSLFLEIFHLVNMMNEIPRKFSHMKEFQEEHKYDARIIDEANFKIAQNKRNRERERKKRLKHMKKQRQLYLKGNITVIERKPKKPTNKWWPIDYGWEIDYYW